MNLFEKQNKPFAIKLSERVKEEIKKEFGTGVYSFENDLFFHYPNFQNYIGFLIGFHTSDIIEENYTLITEAEFFGDGMNKLREKIKSLVPDDFGGMDEDFAIEIEQINDDFAVKFEIFKINNNIIFNKDGWCVFQNEHLTINELLQIFKTQHYE